MFEYAGDIPLALLAVLFWAVVGALAMASFVLFLYVVGRVVSAGWHVSKVKLIKELITKEVDHDRK